MNRFVSAYLADLEARGSSLSLRKSSSYGLEWLTVYLGERHRIAEWRAVTADHLQGFALHLRCEHRTRKGATLKDATVNRLLSVVRAFFRWQHRRGRLLYNPATKLAGSGHEHTLPHVLSERDIARLIETPDIETAIGLRDRALMEVLYATGIRHGEAHRLDLFDVDASARRLIIRLGKGQRDRVVPLTTTAADWLSKYLSTARSELARGQRKQGQPPMMPSAALWLARTGRRLSYAWIEQLIKGYAAQANLKANVHIFRHCCASHLLRHGASIRHIQLLLGHSTLRATEIYLHLDVDDLKRAVSVLESGRRWQP
jgi:integrase/recombinase XerD